MQLHERLNGLGFGDEPVTRRFADESRILRRALGGAVGGGEGSDSLG
ncbi:hypothetical protein [Streptomyces sp. NPDC096323]